VAQVLLHRDTNFSALLELLNGERVRVQKALRVIGWPDSQSDIYAQLSRMSHPSRMSAFLGRTLDFGAEPLKSLVAQQELAGVTHLILSEAAPEDNEARQEHWLFVGLTTFDLAISSLLDLYGAQSLECDWWPSLCISVFEGLAEANPAVKQQLLWYRLQRPNKKQSPIGEEIDHLLDSLQDPE
jgi:hypothetical protein